MTLLLLVVLVLGLLSGGTPPDDPSGDNPPAATDTSATGTAAPTPSRTPGEPTAQPTSPLEGVAATDSPDEYAARVAEIVLGTNPRDHARDDYLTLLLGEVSDEAVGESRERIEPVIAAALPDDYQWLRQRDYGQVNTFEVEHVWEPEVVDDVRDRIPEGYAVRTVAGTQTTRFTDENGDRASSSTPRLLTVFTFCPSDGTCSLVSIPQEVLR
ncbi:hypothetical protein [Jiangella rhizosphaerae]|uniref:Uncharacterized protein n=1 Tax=Jiangella rhizosphaerae TaxID=2293569 RepID=A0A418KTS6_9ACTN|nr:hypothetical protein [Jiangella rhizosphaerae]RIQ29143.1 hypothetical protein DY240_08755 [Jiangella rhizosphaerae]